MECICSLKINDSPQLFSYSKATITGISIRLYPKRKPVNRRPKLFQA
jgi:hypothetical protein